MATLDEITERVRAAVGSDSGLGKSLKFNLKGDGVVFIDGATVSARAYLDDIQEVSVFAAPGKLETPAFAPMLRYLQRRYRVLKTFADGGYQVCYKRG